MHTVGFLIQSCTDVRWRCVICEKTGEADPAAIQAARRPGYDLTDRAPWCQKTGCLGMVWFSVRVGSWMRKLLTSEGEARREGMGISCSQSGSGFARPARKRTPPPMKVTTVSW